MKSPKRIFTTTLFLLCTVFTCIAGVKINEVMPCNFSSIMETDNYNFSGYIEFSNEGGKDVNLKGYTLVHYKKGSNKHTEKWSWEFVSDFTVSANKYTLLWADETEDKNHIQFKLDADGGYLLLKKGATLVDSLAYGKQMPHISFGCYGDIYGYMLPTPGKRTLLPMRKPQDARPLYSAKKED